MSQSSKNLTGRQVKAVIALVVIAFAGLGAYFFVSTETGCSYQNNPGGTSHNGEQNYWEKLVGGICHPLPTGNPPATSG